MPGILVEKREISHRYRDFFDETGIDFVGERQGTRSNYWLNVIKFKTMDERNHFLEYTNSKGVMTRPVWSLMNKLSMFRGSFAGSLENSKTIEEQIVNIPSGVS